MSFTEYISSRQSQLIDETAGHIELVAIAVAIGTLFGLLAGALSYCNRTISGLAIGTRAVLFTSPSFALLGLLIAPLGLGTAPVLVALVVYALRRSCATP